MRDRSTEQSSRRGLLLLPAGHFGTGHGSRQHAPDEHHVIESTNPALHGMAEATLSYVRHLHALAAI